MRFLCGKPAVEEPAGFHIGVLFGFKKVGRYFIFYHIRHYNVV
jgi:hypothetical protein